MTPFDGKCQNLQIFHTHFCARPYSFRDTTFKKTLPPKSKSKSQRAILAIAPFDGKCENLQMSPTNFCAGSYRFRGKTFLIFNLQKVGQGQVRSAIFAITPFDGKRQIYKCLPQLFALSLTVSKIHNYIMLMSKK